MQLEALLREVRACTLCRDLPLGPKPLLQASATARILIAAQAPGRQTHHKGRSFDDPSGKRLRAWMGIGEEVFYDSSRVAIMAMGFCYPGTGKSGDLPPRPECAPAWRHLLLAAMPDIRLTLVIGQYAQTYHMPGHTALTLTERVRQWRRFAPLMFPLPHPSPRNGAWTKAHPWFLEQVVPELQLSVKTALS
jgi:uracil-DNA glycosylase